MAIEIRELIIRAIISDSGDDDGEGEGMNPDNVISESVEQVMDIIEKEGER